MKNPVDIPKIYRRLHNLQAKSEHYYVSLKKFLGRMGYTNEIREIINEKIERRENFAKELCILSDSVKTNRPNVPLLKRPVAVHWITEEELLNVDCTETAKKLFCDADLKSYKEYQYLLNAKVLPKDVRDLANSHTKILENEVL